MKKRLFYALLSLPLLASGANLEMDEFEKTFIEGLEEVSDIATRTKLNIDEMPSFVTILYNETLTGYGVDTVFEALGFVPGVELSMESSGAYQIVLRGVKEKGKIKLLLNGVPINNAFRGSMYYFLDMPIEIVDRIEIIRGPGSVLYGSSAINGVINIVTKNHTAKEKNQLLLSAGTYSQNKGALVHTQHFDALTLSLDAYYQNGNAAIDTGPDRSGNDTKTNETFRDFSAGLYLKGDQWSFSSRYKDSVKHPPYGFGYYSDTSDTYEGNYYRSFNNELGFTAILGDKELNARIGLSTFAQGGESLYAPESELPVAPFAPGSGDVVYAFDYTESSAYTDLALQLPFGDGHLVVLGLYALYTQAGTNEMNIHYTDTPDTPIGSDQLILPDIDRTVTAAYIQDTYSPVESFDLSAGVRIDRYSDFGNAVSPRISAVYAMNERVNLKAMYSKAFRAPSWVELYGDVPGSFTGDPDLDAEVSDTYEIGWVYKEDIDNLIRLNLYRMNIDNIIYRTAGAYAQAGSTHFYGGELEVRKRLGLHTTLNASYSYVSGKDKDDESIREIANHLAQLRLNHRFTTALASATAVKYASPRERLEGDTRDTLEGYTTLDQSLSYQLDTSFKLNLTVKNLLDEAVYYPAPAGTYPEDYRREGRTFWLKMVLEY